MVKRILLLDDEEMIRYGLNTIINKYRAEFCVIGETGDGEEGLKLARNLKPDIIITDIRMPKLNGLEFLKLLTERHICCKVVMLTAYADFEYARTAIKYGAASFILKPINEEELIAELRRISNEDSKMSEGEEEDRIASELVEKILVQHGNLHPLVHKTIKYISVNFNSNISLQDIAKELKVTPAYICKLFTQNMNISLVSFLNHLRIDIAKQLLYKKTYRIYEISDMLGFKNPKYFCKVFSDIVSMSPSKYSNIGSEEKDRKR